MRALAFAPEAPPSRSRRRATEPVSPTENAAGQRRYPRKRVPPLLRLGTTQRDDEFTWFARITVRGDVTLAVPPAFDRAELFARAAALCTYDERLDLALWLEAEGLDCSATVHLGQRVFEVTAGTRP